MDMNTFALRINIGYLKEQGLMEPKAAGVNGSQIGFILDGINRVDNGPDFFEAQDGGKGLFSFGMDEFEGVPLTFEHVNEKELDTAVADPHSCGGPFIFVFSVEEIVLKLLFGDLVRSFLVKIHQLSN